MRVSVAASMPKPVSRNESTTQSPSGRDTEGRNGLAASRKTLRVVTVRIAAVGHRVAGIEGEVEKDLLQLGRIDLDGVERAGELALDQDGFIEAAVEQFERLVDAVIGIDDGQVRAFPAPKESNCFVNAAPRWALASVASRKR